MASILGAVVVKTVTATLGEAIAKTIAKSKAPVPPDVVKQVAIEAVSQSEDIAIVPTKPMRKSVEGWAAAGGALVVLLNQLGPSLGFTISEPISNAVETITAFLGFPAGTGQFLVAVGTVGAFGFIWARRKWFTHTITPAAADRAYDKGKVV